MEDTLREDFGWDGDEQLLGSNQEDWLINESMDGDAESALASAGMGTDEDYGGFSHEEDW